jgi:uncharacterized protein YkwD
MTTRILVTLALCAAAVAPGCGKNPVSSASAGSNSGTTSGGGSASLPRPTTADLIFCVDETNRYRAMRNRPTLSRSTTLEAFAADGARNDGLSNVPHQHVSTTPMPRSGPWGENEVLRWPYNLSPTVQGIIAQAIASFYAEGPGGGHYENVVGPFAQLGCGVYVDNNGMTIIQDFQ